MTEEFFPPRRKSLVFNSLMASVLVLLILALLIAGSITQQNNLAILLLTAGILLLVPLVVVVYRIFVIVSTVYSLNRDALEIGWGLRRELLPIRQIDWVHPITDFETPLPLDFAPLKSAYYGKKAVKGLGRPLFVATTPEEMVLIKQGDQYLIISPENAQEFSQRFNQLTQMGSLTQVEAESENLKMLWQRIWADPWSMFLLVASMVSLLLLFITALTISLVREQIVWVSMELVPASRALLLAVIGSFFSLINAFVGLFFYLQDRVAANIRNLIWSWTVVVNLILTLALIIMAI